MAEERERWQSRIGLVLAAAGNAVGIGNLLRFPSQAAQNGGGAFMIAYVVCLLLFGLPLMWVAWAIGRHGGKFGHTSLPGMLDRIWKSRAAKYVGVLGLALPMVFCLYYTYIEAWCLGYAWFSLTGEYVNQAGKTVDLTVFYGEFLGQATSRSYFSGVSTAAVFLFITLALNIFVLSRGVARGIEILAKIAMPLLILFCLILSVRVLTLPTIKGSAWDGLSFLWSPQYEALRNPNVWMAAAGQIFFTLSIGFGSMECYASYVREKEDIALAGLTTASTNEFVEVIFGSMIVIPAAAIFFGPAMVPEIASSGSFAIGMISMPEILRSLPGLWFFGTMWYLLLFFAAFTSSVAVAQPVVAFLQDEAKLRRGTAAGIVGLIWFLGTLPVIYFFRYGFLDELDYWAGTVGLVVLAIIEAILFAWIFGIRKGWEELQDGALIRIPSVFKYVLKYVTPLALLAIFFGWASQANLKPTPRIIWNVAERANFPGEFVSTESDPTRLKEAGLIRDRILQAAEQAEQDLRAWGEVELHRDGSVHVVNFVADPELAKSFHANAFQDWLSLQGYRYQIRNQNGYEPQYARVLIRLEVLHRAPYIWLARAFMLTFVIVFLVVIASIWHGRRTQPQT